MSRSWKVGFLAVLGIALILFAYHLRAVFMPLLVALVLAYVLNPLLTGLEKKGVPRMASIVGVYAVLALLLSGLVFWAVPAAVDQGIAFVKEVTGPDSKIQKVIVWGGKRLQDWTGAASLQEALDRVRGRLLGGDQETAKAGGELLTAAVSFMTGSLSGFVAVLGFVGLVPVYLFFLLKNLNRWWEALKHCIPRAYRDPALRTLGRIHRALDAFFRGQLTISAIEGLLVFLGLGLFGVKFSLLFGGLYAVLSLFPYVGVLVGFTATELFVLADTGEFGRTFLLVAGLFAFIQVLEGALLQPLILGKETGLHPLLIILGLLVCGQLFGFFGMMIGVPIVCTVKILFEDYVWPVFTEVADLTKVRPRPEPPPPAA
jgi:predicted PurR-regulated permease PerM